MSEPKQPPPLDVDAITRRLPDRSPTIARARAMRAALLDAAQASRPRHRWTWPRWTVGVAFAGALAAAAVAIVVHTLGAPAPIARVTPSAAAAPSAPAAPVPASIPPPSAPATFASTAPNALALASPPPALAPSDGPLVALTDGATVFEASQPVRWTDRDFTLTAPPGARFVVDMQTHHVRSVAVISGWVVIASAHSPARMIVEHQTWTAETVEPTAHTVAPVTVPPRPAPARPPPPQPEIIEPTPPTTSAEPAAPPAPDPAVGEHAFRDGLHALLAGDPHTALGLLDRACNGPAGGVEDSCYWAAVAQLRLGDRPRARHGFDDFLQRWPASSHAGEARVALGWLLVEAGEPVAARVHFAAALNDPLPDVRSEAQRGLAATADPTRH